MFVLVRTLAERRGRSRSIFGELILGCFSFPANLREALFGGLPSASRFIGQPLCLGQSLLFLLSLL